MSEPNDRDYRTELERYWYDKTMTGDEREILIKEVCDTLDQTKKERDQWRNAHNMMAEGNHVVILERDDYKLEIETMPTLEEYNDVCSELINCKKERDAKFSLEEVEEKAKQFKMCPSCKGQMGEDDHYCNICNHRVCYPIEVPWEFIASLKSKEEKE